jgi:colanic acid/amylovoran biosynthesis protein
MRILVEPSGYKLGNLGDVAMLQVTVARLRELWPDASIQVFTRQPEALAKFCPGTVAVNAAGRSLWFDDGYLLGRWHRVLPGWLAERVRNLERRIRREHPQSAASFLQSRAKAQGQMPLLRAFFDSVEQADLLVVSGAGSLNDAFLAHALTVLDTIGLGFHYGKPAALFGQGLGPIHNKELWRRAREILPRVDLLCLRESRGGPALLQSLGIDPSRVPVTGDDAIELAYEQRSNEMGAAIGVNLRGAPYAGLQAAHVERVRRVLEQAHKELGAPLLPVPISHRPNSSDPDVIRRLLDGVENPQAGGEDLDTPLKVIRQIGRCRIVVTGSYHGAVFALGQGIPAVGVAHSEYYKSKFLGLAGEFGAGFDLVFLDDPELNKKLAAAIRNQWDLAEQARAILRKAAARQVERSRAAYGRLRELGTVEKSKAATA